MAQQTAVEWFAEMITEMIHEAYHSELADLFEQAKEMEKQQREKLAFEYSKQGKIQWKKEVNHSTNTTTKPINQNNMAQCKCCKREKELRMGYCLDCTTRLQNETN
jgi:uncharacterized protein (DUF2249 family)